MRSDRFRRVEVVIAHDPALNGLTNPVSLAITIAHADGITERHASSHPTTRLALMQAGQQVFNLHTIGELNLKPGEVRKRQG